MREFLIFKLRCVKCGGLLEMSYDRDDAAIGRIPYASEEPTGADMVQTAIFVRPCRSCNIDLSMVKDNVDSLKRAIDEAVLAGAKL